MVFTDAELAYLDSQPIGRLATQQPDGTLQVNPVGFAWNPETGTIDIGGFRMSRSRKYRNVADNGRAALVVDDLRSTDPWRVRCLDIRGTAEFVPGTGPANGTDPAIIRLRPTRVIGLAIEDPDVPPHEIRANARNV
ncbi:PPOX class F420-dependent oxidoreductase [Pseudonocardia endophytica]|nr:PPOX class F420-dependent oxidoreductase [Pseudonocardia endophytica]